MVTTFARYPRLTALRLVGLVGERPARWVGLMRAVQDWAREQGCERVEAMAPARWTRLLGRLGFREFHVLTEVDL